MGSWDWVHRAGSSSSGCPHLTKDTQLTHEGARVRTEIWALCYFSHSGVSPGGRGAVSGRDAPVGLSFPGPAAGGEGEPVAPALAPWAAAGGGVQSRSGPPRSRASSPGCRASGFRLRRKTDLSRMDGGRRVDGSPATLRGWPSLKSKTAQIILKIQMAEG